MTLAQTVDSIVADAISQRLFPGAVVLIARAGQLLHAAAYGSTMYDAPDSRPVLRDTIYDIASLTKVFTATMVLQLLDAGQIDLAAPACRYLPELQARTITLQHLLTHTSGLDIRLSALRAGGRAGVLDAVYAATPIHPPGSTVAYTNVNSLLLGEIVERLRGEPLDAAFDALIRRPLGLRDTSFRPVPELRPRIAPTEIDAGWRGGLVHGAVHDESAYALGGVAGHAGLFSTADDLWRFCAMWLAAIAGAPALLSGATARLAARNHTSALSLGCGLGWMIDRPGFMGHAPPDTIGHTGFTGPALVLVPQQQLAVIVLSNRVYPYRSPPEHHRATTAIVDAALGV